MVAKEPLARAHGHLARLIVEKDQQFVIIPRVAIEQEVGKQVHRFWKEVAHEATTHFRFGPSEPQHDWHVRYERSFACFTAISTSYVTQQIAEFTRITRPSKPR